MYILSDPLFETDHKPEVAVVRNILLYTRGI